MAYFEGNAIYIRGGQVDKNVLAEDTKKLLTGGFSNIHHSMPAENRGALQIIIDDCIFKNNYGLNVGFGGAVSIDGRQNDKYLKNVKRLQT